MHWQREWIAALTAPGGLPPGLASARDAARFALYRASHEATLAHALADTYPVTERLVGTDFFHQTARTFLRGHPSHCSDIHAWGCAFPAFLRTLPATSDMPWLADVARLEWWAHEAFHAADAVHLTTARLATLPESAYGSLRLLPSVRLMASQWPVHLIWQINQPAWPDEAVPDLSLGAVELAIWRDGDDIAVLPVSCAAYALACGIQRSGALGQCDALDALDDPGTALSELVAAGLLTTPPQCGATQTERQTS